jgi:hypothetical protein
MMSPSATRSPTAPAALVDAGALVGAHELAQAVDVDALGRAILAGRPHHDARAVDLVDHAGRRATMVAPESRATAASMPVPTSGASARISGTAWRCMFEPISARLASSFSRNGISAAATETSCFGDTSIAVTSSASPAGSRRCGAPTPGLGEAAVVACPRRIGLRHDQALSSIAERYFQLVLHLPSLTSGTGVSMKPYLFTLA